MLTDTWQVDVTVSSHDLLKLGVTEAPVWNGGDTWTRVVIAADSACCDNHAVILAAHIATVFADRFTGVDMMPTSAVLVSYPIE